MLFYLRARCLQYISLFCLSTCVPTRNSRHMHRCDHAVLDEIPGAICDRFRVIYISHVLRDDHTSFKYDIFISWRVIKSVHYTRIYHWCDLWSVHSLIYIATCVHILWEINILQHFLDWKHFPLSLMLKFDLVHLFGGIF